MSKFRVLSHPEGEALGIRWTQAAHRMLWGEEDGNVRTGAGHLAEEAALRVAMEREERWATVSAHVVQWALRKARAQAKGGAA